MTVPVIMLLYMSDCPVCEVLTKLFDAKIDRTKISFSKINVQQFPEIAERNKVEKFPCTLFFKEGNLIAKKEGYIDEKALKFFMDKIV